LLLALEYDGAHHLTPERALRDLRRQAYLSAAGWEVLRFAAKDVFRPRLIAARTRAILARRSAERQRCALLIADR
jgi:very-short-patch-repair endonuclease